MTSSTLLITGASDSTGRHLIAAASEKGLRCMPVAQHAGHKADGAAENLVADLLDPAALERVILSALAGYEIGVSVNPEFVRSDEIKILYGMPVLLESTIGDYREHALIGTLGWMLRGEN